MNHTPHNNGDAMALRIAAEEPTELEKQIAGNQKARVQMAVARAQQAAGFIPHLLHIEEKRMARLGPGSESEPQRYSRIVHLAFGMADEFQKEASRPLNE